MRAFPTLLVGAVLAIAPSRGVGQTIFDFRTDEFWLNLHHYLYVLGRATTGGDADLGASREAEHAVTLLSPVEQGAWRGAVKYYADSVSNKDLIRNDTLVAATRMLAAAGDIASIETVRIDAVMRIALERAASIYRKMWWPRHRAANVAARDSIQSLVTRHGRQMLAFITRSYQLPWPLGGVLVHFSGYANWAGAYSARGGFVVVSSLDSSVRESRGLETVFHEAMHAWDDSIFVLLRAHARQHGKLTPLDLSHALIFYTSGEAVHRAIPGHVTAGDDGIWQSNFGRVVGPLRKYWQPWLDGTGTRDEAFEKLIEATATERRPR